MKTIREETVEMLDRHIDIIENQLLTDDVQDEYASTLRKLVAELRYQRRNFLLNELHSASVALKTACETGSESDIINMWENIRDIMSERPFST